MPKEITEIRVFVSCPSDVEDLRSIARSVSDEINHSFRDRCITRLLVLDWDKSVIPQFGPRPQELINERIGEYDVLIGILWKRFGTPTGGVSPLTGQQYESGTEEEFSIAYDRWREMGVPLINMYFKKPDGVTTSHEAEQLNKVLEFKERLQTEYRGWTVDFTDQNDFERKVRKFLQKVILDLHDAFTERGAKEARPTEPIRRKSYPEIENYLPRKVCPTKNISAIERQLQLYRDELLQDFLTVVEQNNRIVLLGDPGVGKSVELQRVAWHFSKDNSPFYPFLITLDKYVNQSLAELLHPSWKGIPDKQLLIVLDGLDEIESKNKNDAIRQIELFSEQHPDTHIAVSCRTNFYRSETEQSSGTLPGFSSYILLELGGREIERYIKTKLPARAGDFDKAISGNQLQDLPGNPFYLISLVQLFKAKGALPRKADIFEQLLIARIRLDKKHYRTAIELGEKQNAIVEVLERLGLGMELLGRNYIDDNEFHELVPEESLRKLVKYCTLWKRKEEGETVTWQFEHNNFQEYLAARVLSRQPLETVKEFISFKPTHRKIIPSWVNTLSFLLSMSDDSGLFEWILDCEPELAVKLERVRIDDPTRIKIFKKIFNDYKRKHIWIDRDKFRYSELAGLGESDEIIDLLLSEAETATHYTTIGNAIELLGNMAIPPSRTDRATRVLVARALDNDVGEVIQSESLIALADAQLNSEDVVNRIVPALRLSDSDWVRFALYHFLWNSDYLDENIDVFLEGIRYVRFDYRMASTKARLGDEDWHLKIGLERAKSPEAIKRIFSYFKANPRDSTDVFFEKAISSIAGNAADAYSKDPSIFDAALELFEAFSGAYLERQAKELILFFEKTNTRHQAFERVFQKRKGDKDALLVLADLADQNCVELFVQQYEEHNIANDDVREFQNLLRWRNPDLYQPFTDLINKISGDKFTPLPTRDLEGERRERRQRDIGLLFAKEAFLREIEVIFVTEKKQNFTRKELFDVETRHWDRPYFSDLAMHILREIAGELSVSLESAIRNIKGRDWGLFCVSKIYEYQTSEPEIVLSEQQQEWIRRWCHSNVKKVDFRTALVTEPHGRSGTNWRAVCLWYFLRKLNLEYPKDTLLDMLSFDWHDGYGLVGIQYLEDRLNRVDVTNRILGNLEGGIQNDHVLQNHIGYCGRNRIKEVLPFALAAITDVERNNLLRGVALETVCELSESLSALEEKLRDIKDDFKWKVVGQLIERQSTYCLGFLRDALHNGEEDEKLKAAEYLMQLQDIEGLRYHVQWLREHKRVPEGWIHESPLQQIRTPESVPYLLELLELNYQQDFARDDFNTVERGVLDALTAIALQSDQHYGTVKEAVENFIEEYSSSLKNVNFLHAFLEKLEQKYYVVKSEKLNISDAIKKLKKIYPQFY